MQHLGLTAEDSVLKVAQRARPVRADLKRRPLAPGQLTVAVAREKGDVGKLISTALLAA